MGFIPIKFQRGLVLFFNLVIILGIGAHAQNHDHHSEIKSKTATSSDTSQTKTSPLDSTQISALIDKYTAIQTALSQDNFENAKVANLSFGTLAKNLKSKNSQTTTLVKLQNISKQLAQSKTLSDFRTQFVNLSDVFITLLDNNPYPRKNPAVLVYCPMALNNKGAHWIQGEGKIQNPYFGTDMLTCGSKKKTFKYNP